MVFNVCGKTKHYKHKRECRQSNEEKYDISGHFQAVEGFLLATTRAKGNNSSTGLGLISSGDDCCG